ncbi:MAG: hypothetical protein DLM66_10770 [Candidatus Dormiibacter spiritus]|nr:MAG: hypothetical protein DLM66_10770 [Candidatus Dormibacteraeota bacterium]
MGSRQGEALGLLWRDVDLRLGYLRISKQLQRIDLRLRLVDLNTDRSRRTLVMPTSIVNGLREHRARQAEEHRGRGVTVQSEDLVFTHKDGGGLEGTTVTRHFHEHLDRAGLPQRRFHDLRHSCAIRLPGPGGITARRHGGTRTLGDRDDDDHLTSFPSCVGMLRTGWRAC